MTAKLMMDKLCGKKSAHSNFTNAQLTV